MQESPWVAPADPPWPPHPLPVDPSPFALLGLALGAGIALDIGVRGGLHNGVVALGVVMIVAVLVTSHRVERAGARWLAIAALVPAGFLMMRASPWLAASNVGAIVMLITLSVSFSCRFVWFRG